MKLSWTTEKREKETIRLFLQRNKFLEKLYDASICLAIVWPIASVFVWIYSSCADTGRLSMFLGTLILLFGLWAFVFSRLLTRIPRRAYRQRGTNRVEYRFTDDTFAFKVGELSFSSPWNKVAKEFRIDKKVIYLYGKDLPFEAQCIPDWQGHGVEKKELITALRDAGLKKVIPYGLKSILFNGLVIVVLMIYIYVGGKEWDDGDIPNEEELRLVANEVPDGDNAWLLLHGLTNICTVVCDHSRDDVSFVRNYGIAFAGNDSDVLAVRDDPASSARAAEILAANEKFFGAFRAALSHKGFFDKERAAWDKERTDKRTADLFPKNSCLQGFECFIRFAQLVAFKTQVALENDDIGSAISDIGDIHTLGQMISTNSMSFTEYLVGGLIEKLSYEKMCDAIAMDKVSNEALERFGRMVATGEANAALCRKRALKAEYANQVALFKWYGNMQKINMGDVPRERIRLVRRCQMTPSWLFRFIFRRRETCYRVAAMYRTMIAGEDDPDPTKCPEWPKRDFWMGLRPNLVGNILICSLIPEYGLVFKDRSWERARPRLVLAAAKWRRAHGGVNPPSLEALVPDYLAAVPRDPWSKKGEPIKYDASLGVAWSVGKYGKYDYRKIAKDNATGNNVSVDGDTQKYAFRLDGKPIGLGAADPGEKQGQ